MFWLYRLYVFLMFVLVLFGPLKSRAEATFDFRGPTYELRLHDLEDRQIVFYRGGIQPGDSRKPLEEMISKLVPGKNVELVLGIGLGGDRDKHIYFGDSLRAACPKVNCKITTYARSICASACVWLFMYGDERLADSNAIFGFHRAGITVLGTRIAVQSRKGLVKRFVKFGADPEWMMKNIEQLTSQEKIGIYATPEQMICAKIATKIDDTFSMRSPIQWPSIFLSYAVIPDWAPFLKESH